MSNNHTIYFNSNLFSGSVDKPPFSSINAESNGDKKLRGTKRKLDFRDYSEPLLSPTKKRILSENQLENQENIPNYAKSAIATHNLAPETIEKSTALIAPIWYEQKLEKDWGFNRKDPTRVIGEGGFGCARLSDILGPNGLPLVIKTLSPYKSKNPEKNAQLAENELNILQFFAKKFLAKESVPHIVKQHGHVSISPTNFATIQENGGESLHHIYLDPKNPDKKTIDWPTLQEIAKQTLTGLAYLHMEAGIAHNDLKPHNIGYFKGNITILDFGLAQFIKDKSGYPGGTPIYRAPETFSRFYSTLDPAQKTKADIWGFGCTLFELFTQERFAKISKETPNRILELFYAIKSRLNLSKFPAQINEHKDFFSSPGVLRESDLPPLPKLVEVIRSIEKSPKAEEFIDLLNQMLVWNPIARQSAIELLTHPFFFTEYVILTPIKSPSSNQGNDQPVPSMAFYPNSSLVPEKLAKGEVEYSAGYFLN